MGSNSSGSGGTIFASVLITLVVVGAGIYIGLPYLYPNINKTTPTPTGLITQIQSVQSTSGCAITDANTTLSGIPNMALNFTIGNQSRIQAVYQTTVQLYIPFNVAGDFRFNISISIKGVGTQTTMIEYFLDADTTAPLYISQPISLELLTMPLLAGTYIANMTWVSCGYVSGQAYMKILPQSLNYYPQSLTLEEITT